MEFSCIIITDYKTERTISIAANRNCPLKQTHIFDYEQKYMPGRATKFTPARDARRNDSSHSRNLHTKLCKYLEIKTISRIDGFVTTDDTSSYY